MGMRLESYKTGTKILAAIIDYKATIKRATRLRVQVTRKTRCPDRHIQKEMPASESGGWFGSTYIDLENKAIIFLEGSI